jgi:CubicO group peptidase (beta-lactamase class C family)
MTLNAFFSRASELKMALSIRAALALAMTCALNALSAQSLPQGSAQQAGFSSEGLGNIDAFFDREIKANRVPGAVIAIARDGKLIYQKAYGFLDKAQGTPMPSDAIFALASMTKIMTSVAALTLNQEGRLPLRSPVSNYYPAFGQMQVGVPQADGSLKLVPQNRPMYVHDLMRHTSGLTYGGRGDHPIAKLYPGGTTPALEGSTEEFIERITKLPLAHQPGVQFEYSFSTDVLGAVVEKVSGKRLGEYLQDKVWKPLGMVDATFNVPSEKRGRIAKAFANNPLDGKPQSIVVIDQQTKSDCGGACAFSTVSDYLRFGQMLMNGGVLDGKRILSPQMVALLTANHLGPEIRNTVGVVEGHREGYGFGLGVAVRVQPGLAAVPGNVGEYSWNGAYGTAFFADPKEKLVVVVGTAAPGELRKYYREQVQALVYGAMTR